LIIPTKRRKELQSCLMMFFTGISRFGDKIADIQVKATKDKTAELKEMLGLVDEAEKVLVSGGDIAEFGKLLDHTWKLKRGLTSEISTDFIDQIYQTAKDKGAIGGKLLGAGGGGFMVFFAEPGVQPKIRAALKDLVHIPFQFENEGAKIFHYTPSEYDTEDNSL
jgi:D-glycero-alpha-D-manno-heptose-7-phosphate kinase